MQNAVGMKGEKQDKKKMGQEKRKERGHERKGKGG